MHTAAVTRTPRLIAPQTIVMRRLAKQLVRPLPSSGRGAPEEPINVAQQLAPGDYHFSHYSLAHADCGVCIDMTNGRVRFDWSYVPLGKAPGSFAAFARRLHFRNGSHVDEPIRQIQVPQRPLAEFR